jgi:hypothetical protein
LDKKSLSGIICSVLLVSTTQARALVYTDYSEVAMFGASVNAELYNDPSTGATVDLPAYDPSYSILFDNSPAGYNIDFRPNSGNDSTSSQMRYQYDETEIYYNGMVKVYIGNLMIGLVGEICIPGAVSTIQTNVEYMIDDYTTNNYTDDGRVVLMAYPTHFFPDGHIECTNSNVDYMDQACAYNDWAKTTADRNSNIELIDPWEEYNAADKLHADTDSMIRASANIKTCFEGDYGTSCRRYNQSMCASEE